MMLVREDWRRLIAVALLTISGTFIIIYGIISLTTSGTTEAGILKLWFNFQNVSERELTPSGVGGGIVHSLQSEAPSVSSAALSATGRVQTLVSSAVTTIQSDSASVIPRNCTLGTRRSCVGYINHVNCSPLPLNVSSLASRALSVSYPTSSLEELDEVLKNVNSVIEGGLIFGIISTAIFICTIQYIFWKEEFVAYQFYGVPLETIVGLAGNLICFIFFVYPTIMLSFVFSKTEHLPLNITSGRGNLIDNCFALVCAAIIMTVCVALISAWHRGNR